MAGDTNRLIIKSHDDRFFVDSLKRQKNSIQSLPDWTYITNKVIFDDIRWQMNKF